MSTLPISTIKLHDQMKANACFDVVLRRDSNPEQQDGKQ